MLTIHFCNILVNIQKCQDYFEMKKVIPVISDINYYFQAI